MEKFKGTPGPWRYVRFSHGSAIMRGTDVISSTMGDKQIANGLLIAAAPDLLEAVNRFIQNGFQTPSNIDMDFAKEAYRKALNP